MALQNLQSHAQQNSMGDCSVAARNHSRRRDVEWYQQHIMNLITENLIEKQQWLAQKCYWPVEYVAHGTAYQSQLLPATWHT